MCDEVKAWEEDIIIPTYPIGSPEKNPMFLEKRIYQGSSGVVYPHAVIEKIADVKVDKIYKAIYVENVYIKVMILPELGGRIQMAYDKIKERHFIYYNQVIKPALVGLTGPWISGGIEFNWPQHHRPSTFEPVDFTIEENEDGSKTVWVNEVERMFRTKGMAGFTLYPDKAYIEIKGKLYNRTPFPQTFLWWANPAVKVSDYYQSVFPPDVYAVFDHGKRDVSSFPIATGTYYKVDYFPGTDISKYKNIPVPTSYMAITSKYNFIGGYEHDTKAGLLHVANHHISPGKKQWTWGHGAFGRAWDRNLTDDDGPYVELMTGIFTDNQPDFSWMHPYEEKTFVQYFMPYQAVGMVKNATKDAVINIEADNHIIAVKLYVTAVYDNVKVSIKNNEKEIFSENISISPATPYVKNIQLTEHTNIENIQLIITNVKKNKVLVSYKEEAQIEHKNPVPAKAPKRPIDVENNEQLYLTGLHLEQYRHATYVATDYYKEALKRDPKDTRNNNAMGLWYLRRGQFAKAIPYFKQAITTLIQRNPNPYDGETYFNLGWALKMQNKPDEAFEMFYKSVWNDAWQHAGYLNLSRIAVLKENYEEALELIDKSLIKNWNSHTARHIRAVVLRKLNKQSPNCIIEFIDESLKLDPFNFGCLFEKYLLISVNDTAAAEKVVAALKKISRGWVHNFIEYAFDYAHCGLYKEAEALLHIYAQQQESVYPMVAYYIAWFVCQSGDSVSALTLFKKAASLNPNFVFPNRIEDVLVLQKAIAFNSADAKALYYLGNFWYDKRQYADAIECWEKSIVIDNSFATVHRNLSLAYYNKLNNPKKALAALEKAFALDVSDARVLMELDQLYKKINTPFLQRLSILENNLALVQLRDDLYLERIALYNQLGNYKKALELISSYTFHPWEGGEGKVVNEYLICNIALAKQAIEKCEYNEALALLNHAQSYPLNLGEGKLAGVQENDINYLKGLAYESLGLKELAHDFYQQATEGASQPIQAIFYNDAPPDKIFYQGLAWLKLNQKEKANTIFNRLMDFGMKHVDDDINIDYFAVSLPDLLVFESNLNLCNKIHCMYLIALGNMGLNYKTQPIKIKNLFDEILQFDVNHQGAIIHKKMIDFLMAVLYVHI